MCALYEDGDARVIRANIIILILIIIITVIIIIIIIIIIMITIHHVLDMNGSHNIRCTGPECSSRSPQLCASGTNVYMPLYAQL